MALLEPESLSYGHYECRSLDETLPVFTDLLASEVVRREDRRGGGASTRTRRGRSWCTRAGRTRR